jgi:hypothetical protein
MNLVSIKNSIITWCNVRQCYRRDPKLQLYSPASNLPFHISRYGSGFSVRIPTVSISLNVFRNGQLMSFPELLIQEVYCGLRGYGSPLLGAAPSTRSLYNLWPVV